MGITNHKIAQLKVNNAQLIPSQILQLVESEPSTTKTRSKSLY